MPITYEIEKKGRVLTWYRDYINYPHHFHESIELIAVERGSCIASVDLEEYRLEAGDVFVVFPGRIHSYSDENDIECYTFLFPAEVCPTLSQEFNSSVPLCPVLHANDTTRRLFDIIREIYACNLRKGHYDKHIARGYLAVLCATMLSMLELEPAVSSDPTAEKRVIDYCTENYRTPLTLDILSRKLYISRHHISYLFSSKLNISFNDFVNQLRVREACLLIDEGVPVTEAALRSGFGSIRTFNRAFQKERGITPTEYRKSRAQRIGTAGANSTAR